MSNPQYSPRPKGVQETDDFISIETNDGTITVKTGSVFGVDLPDLEFSVPYSSSD